MWRKFKIYRLPTATFVLDTPIVSDQGGEQLSHYTRGYWIAASDAAEALDMVRADARADGATMLDAESPVEGSAIDVPLTPMQRALIGRRREICWKSGRVFFPAA